MLSKKWTLKRVSDVIRNLVNTLEPDKVQDLTIVDYINLAVDDCAEMLSEATQPDYGVSEEINIVTPSSVLTFISGYAYTLLDKSIEYPGISNGIQAGDGIVITNTSNGKVGFGKVTSVTDDFVFTDISMPANISESYCQFITYPVSVTTFDTANLTYSVDRIVKIVSSSTGLISKKSDLDIENVSGISQFAKSIVYNQFGDKLYFQVGSGVTSVGTVTAYYYRQPIHVVNDSDYLDIKDKYMPLVIAKVKNYIYEQLSKIPPEGLTSLIESKTAQIRQANNDEQNALAARK